MRYLTFGSEERQTYPIVFLTNSLRSDNIEREHLDPLKITKSDAVAIQVHQNQTKKKTPRQEQLEWIREELVPTLTDLKTEFLFVSDGEYFKTLTNKPKIEAWLGYVLDSVHLPGVKVMYLPPADSVFYAPDKVREKIHLVVDGYLTTQVGIYIEPGSAIIKFADYPRSVERIGQWLDWLLEENKPLFCDTENYSLKFATAGLATITFCWSDTEGICFPVDTLKNPEDVILVRKMLKKFFKQFQNDITYHNAGYDVTVLIYQLFMTDILDMDGLYEGLETLCSNWHDTKIIAYLALNSCAGNDLSLKELAQGYSGNYAVDVSDVTKIPLDTLLRYNLVDGLSTAWVFNKYYPMMIEEDQLEIYNNLFMPALKDIIHMQLTGLPVDMQRVKEVTEILQQDSDNALLKLQENPLVQEFNYYKLESYVEERNQTWKKKRTTIEEIRNQAEEDPKLKAKITLNPSSGPQLIKLLYEQCGLPVIATTDSKLPSTDGDTLKALLHHTEDPNVKDLLQALRDFKAVEKILTSTMPALAEALEGPDGWHYLVGNFNLGGTVSGRLSSSNPNLQNLPATGTKYAKSVKSCFRAPPGWVFCGIDFNSLEDRISALTTKDPEKIKVYTDGFDGHCLRAYSYFVEDMVGIDPNSVESINSIADKYGALRQESKAPTFALTYQGTFKTLMVNCGFSEEKAKKIERRFKELYVVSIQWVSGKLDEASRRGYVLGAFGLKVRTPLLHQVIRGTKKTPREADAEGRTAGNALGQSWCLLNSRAGTEFLRKVRGETPMMGHNGGPAMDFRYSIRPCAQIHDAQYYLIRDDLDAILFANEHVVKACEWQDHPDIWHDEVKLGGTFFLCWPSWEHEIKIPNGADAEQVSGAITKYVTEYEKKNGRSLI